MEMIVVSIDDSDENDNNTIDDNDRNDSSTDDCDDDTGRRGREQ